MPVQRVKIKNVEISRFIIGGNPVSGFSHQTVEKDNAMRHYFTTKNVKAMLAESERLGVNTHLSRADHHVMRYLMEYWDDGGRIQWFAQTCPEVGSIVRGVQNAINGKASAVHIHGGVMDHIVASGDRQDLMEALSIVRKAGMPVGIAGHNVRVFEWAEKNLDVDYYMCCYYNPTDRSRVAEHVHGAEESYDDRDRDAMVSFIAKASRPVIHYKILAAGRNDPRKAFAFAAKHMRAGDAVCVGIYPGESPASLAEDLRFLDDGLAAAAGGAGNRVCAQVSTR